MERSAEQSASDGQASEPLTGSCLCGGVRYEISAELGPIVMCHCTMCRKASGSAFATNALVARAGFRVVRGADLIREYESSPQKWRCFCGVCGGPIYSRSMHDPERVRIRIGLLDRDPGRAPVCHYMAEFKAPWDRITDELPLLDFQTGQMLSEAERRRLLDRQE